MVGGVREGKDSHPSGGSRKAALSSQSCSHVSAQEGEKDLRKEVEGVEDLAGDTSGVLGDTVEGLGSGWG